MLSTRFWTETLEDGGHALCVSIPIEGTGKYLNVAQEVREESPEGIADALTGLADTLRHGMDEVERVQREEDQ